MKIAIVGSGISGLACAYYLHRDHEVHVFEASRRIGGHTATVDVTIGGKTYAIDTGFIVYNDWTYPNFIALLDELRVANEPTNMSFSVSDRRSGLEYAGSNLNTLFAQRGNLVSPRFLGMLRDIVRFNKDAVTDLDSGRIDADMTLGEYLHRNGYGEGFIQQYLVPMGSAIWSADTHVMQDFPLQFFVRFFRNHGLLNLRNRPQWRVIAGGSRNYLGPLTQGFKDNIHTNAPVNGVKRHAGGAKLSFPDGRVEQFDHVVLACHSDQALKLLQDPSAEERSVLGAMRYQDNEVILHTDIRLLPRSRKTWSAWNYLLTAREQRAVLTYNMNILQGLSAPETFCVTLNHTAAISPYRILGRFNYAHPVFTIAGVAAQQRWSDVNRAPTWYCGAYWHNGFHEDGVRSARQVADAILGQSSGKTGAMVSAA
jgi:predicted NAD/FAD-binding protein